MLQPIAADTPLAELFNEFLRTLAHAEAHTCARYPSYARRYLQDVTEQLHATHHAAVRALAGFEAGRDPAKLSPHFRVLARHLEGTGPVFAYSCLPERITSPAKLAELNNLNAERRHKLVIATPAYALCARLLAALTVGRKAETEYYFLGTPHGLGAEDVAGLVRAMLALDFATANAINAPIYVSPTSTHRICS